MADTSAPVLFSYTDVTATRPVGDARFTGFTWTVREGETWAVVGPVASGKTTLGELLAGRLVVRAGHVEWPLLDRVRAAGKAVTYPSDLVYRVAFKEESRLFSYAKHYYQQRFNFVEKDEDLTLGDFLRTGVRADESTIQAAANRLGVGALLGQSFLKLSNGQTRRARLARAVLMEPELLILDDPFIGVDAAGREEVTQILGELAQTGHRLLLITRPDAIPDWVTHVLELDGMKVLSVQSSKFQVQRPAVQEPQQFERETLNFEPSSPIVELRGVTVAYEGKRILDDLTWTVRSGERWALLGPNGSGKTTLLSLLCGDHPQAYANDVRLFGQRRGSGESIWDIKQRVGLVSPELHLYFTEPLTAAETVATGFADVVVYYAATPKQRATVRELLDRLGLSALADRPFSRISTGEQRLILLARALVKKPRLLILDEPFQSLDAAWVARCRDWLDRELTADQTLLFVTHHAEEVPATVNHRLRLDRGRIAERG